MIPDNLYEAAFTFRETKLWQQLYDSQLFALKHSDGTIGYCCVMGMMGEHFALAVYPGAEGLAAYRRMGTRRSGMSDFENDELTFSQDCVMCSFENKDEMRPGELAEARLYCKVHGITLRGENAYPKFQRFRPNYYPWSLEDTKDQAYLLEALQACLDVYKKLETAYAEDLGFTEGAPFDRSIPLLKRRGRGWTWGLHDFPEPAPIVYPTATVEDELRLERIKKAGAAKGVSVTATGAKKATTRKKPSASDPSGIVKRRSAGQEWACDVLMYPSATRQEDDPGNDAAEDDTAEPLKAPFFPYLLMVIDHNGGKALHAALT